MAVHALRLYLFALLFVTIATTVPGTWGKSTGCQGEFKGRCQCKYVFFHPENGDEPREFLTNCTKSDFTSTSMLQELPLHTQKLIFTGNRINRIRSHVFGTAEYPKLEDIDLSNNGIRRIDAQAFKKTTRHVEILNLSGNLWELDDESNIFMDFPSLRELHLVGAFGPDQFPEDVLNYLRKYFDEAKEQLKHLEILHLENNYFEHMEDDSFFCFLPKLRELYLSNNKISSFKLTPRCLRGVPHLEFIDLSRNKLQHLSNRTMEALDAIPRGLPKRDRQIDLNFNDFPCNCSINDMLKWMNTTETDMVNRDEYTCQVINPSDEVRTMRLADLEGNRLPCIDPLHSHVAPPTQSPSRAGYIVLATIIIILIAISAALAFVNRGAVHQFLRNRTSPLQHKFEYSTIGGKRDASEVDV